MQFKKVGAIVANVTEQHITTFAGMARTQNRLY